MQTSASADILSLRLLQSLGGPGKLMRFLRRLMASCETQLRRYAEPEVLAHNPWRLGAQNSPAFFAPG